MGDPWANAAQRFAVGSAIEGTVTSLPKFGAFVQLSEGVEGMIHVSEISAEKRINHPQEVLKVGQTVKAQVLAVDADKRLIRLSMKQLVPTSLDEYLAEHKAGDVVTGRLTEVSGSVAHVELGEGVLAICPIAAQDMPKPESGGEAKVDVSALGSMLMSRWKGSAAGTAAKPEAVHAGQIRELPDYHAGPRDEEDRVGAGVARYAGFLVLLVRTVAVCQSGPRFHQSVIFRMSFRWFASKLYAIRH